MDMNYLLLYLEENYGLISEKKVQSAIKIVCLLYTSNSIFFRRSTDNHTPKLYQYNCEAYKQPASPGFS